MRTSVLLAAGLLVLSSCSSTPSARKSYEAVLRHCADVPNGMVYLGPSNTYGPGSAWRKNGREYLPRWSLQAAVAAATERKPLIRDGNDVACKGSKTSSWNVDPKLAVTTPTVNLSAELSAALERSNSVKVTAEAVRIDRLEELNYEVWAKSEAAAAHGADLDENNRLVMTAAVYVKGYKAEFAYKPSVAADIKASGDVSSVDAEANLSAKWTSETTLEVSAANPFYMAGQLSPVLPGRILGANAAEASLPLINKVPEAVPLNATVRKDPTSSLDG